MSDYSLYYNLGKGLNCNCNLILFIFTAHLIVNGTDVDRKKILEEMTAVINIKEQPKLSNRVVKDMPLREKYNPITSRVPDETRRVLCSQVCTYKRIKQCLFIQ